VKDRNGQCFHIYILGNAPEGCEWDHFDRNRLNNTRDNLRAITPSQNMSNTGLRSNNASGTTGVYFSAARNKWCAEIAADKKRIFLGRFVTYEEACIAREQAELMYKDR
jgi:hypothetical protein